MFLAIAQAMKKTIQRFFSMNKCQSVKSLLLLVGSLLMNSVMAAPELENAALATGSITLNKSFDRPVIQTSSPFNVSTLSIVINNQVAGKALTNLNLTDNLPSGLTIASTPNKSVICAPTASNLPTLTAVSGTNFLKITGGAIPFGTTCTFSADVVTTIAGTYTNKIEQGSPLGQLGSEIVIVPEDAQASVTVMSRPSDVGPKVRKKEFSPNSIFDGQTAKMTITLGHDNIVPLTNVRLDDTFPAGMIIANPSNGSTTCPDARVNAAAGAGSFSMSAIASALDGATIPVDSAGTGSCTVSVDVIGINTASSGTVNRINTLKAGDVKSQTNDVILSNTGAGSGTLAVVVPFASTIVKRFSATTVAPNQWSTMTWTISNNSINDWSNLTVSDTLPSGLTLLPTPTPSTTCTSGQVTTISNTNGTQTLKLSGASLGTKKTCTVTARVVAATTGTYNNTIDANTMTYGSVGSPITITHLATSAILTVQTPGGGQAPTLSLTKTFIKSSSLPNIVVNPTGGGAALPYPATVPGGPIQMSITLTKKITDGFDTGLSSLYFKDDWGTTAPYLQYVSTSSNSCGGTVAVTPTSFTLTNATLPQGTASCSVTLNLKANTSHSPSPQGTMQTNSVSACVGSAAGCTGTSAGPVNATALIMPAFRLVPTKAFAPTNLSLNGTTRASFTIYNPAPIARTSVIVKDTLPTGLQVATPMLPGISCVNNGSTANWNLTVDSTNRGLTAFIPLLSALNTTTGAMASCTISFDVVAASDTSENSSWTNSILAGGVYDSGGPMGAVANQVPADAIVTFTNSINKPIVAKGFSPALIYEQDASQPLLTPKESRLTIQVVNTNTTTNGKFTVLSLTDDLPAGVKIATTPHLLIQSCGSATVTAAANSSAITISNATVNANTVCEVSVDVVGTSTGNKINIIPKDSVQTAERVQNESAATATLAVLSTKPQAVLRKDVFKQSTTTSIQGQPVAPGSKLTYQIEIYNPPGGLPAVLKNDVKTVTDMVPVGTTLIAGSVVADDPNVIITEPLGTGLITWNFANSSRTLTGGSTPITLKFDVTVDANNTALISNVAQMPNAPTPISSCAPYDSANQNCFYAPPSANCATPIDPLNPQIGECHPVSNPIIAEVEVTKIHIGPLRAGYPATYQLSLKNSGGSATIRPIAIADTLPTGMSLANISQITSPDGAVSNLLVNGQVLSFDFTPTTAMDKNQTAIINLTVDIAPTLNGNVTNSVCVANDQAVAQALLKKAKAANSNVCSTDTGQVTQVLLKLQKSGPERLNLGETAEYILTISNIGNIATDGALYLKDVLPQGLTLNGTISSDDGTVEAVTTDEQTISFKFTPQNPLEPGNHTLTLKVPVLASFNANPNNMINYASVAGGYDAQGDTPPLPGADCTERRCANTSTTLFEGLKLQKTHEGNFEAGQEGSYILTVTNKGGSAVSGLLHFADALPAGLSLVETDPITANVPGTFTNIIFAANSPNVSFDFTPTNPIAQNVSIAIKIKVKIAENVLGDITNYASVTADSTLLPPGPTCLNVHLCSNDTVAVTQVLLHLAKNGPTSLSLGGTGSYTLTINNTGTAATEGILKFKDTLPLGMLLNGNITSSDGGVVSIPSQSGQTINFDFTPANPLAVGGANSVILTVPVKVSTTANIGSVTNYASVAAGNDALGNVPSTPENCSNDRRCANTATEIMKGLILQKSHTGVFEVGKVGTYLLRVTNNTGSPIATGSVLRFQDMLPEGMSLITTTPLTSANGSIHLNTNTPPNFAFDLTLNSSIAEGDIIEVGIKVDIGVAALGNATNYASVTLDPVPLNPKTGCANANLCSQDAVVVTGHAQLALKKEGPPTMTVEDNALYQLTIHNGGNAPTNGLLSLVDQLPAGLNLSDVITSAQGEISNIVTSGSVGEGIRVSFSFLPTTPLAVGTDVLIRIPVRVEPVANPGVITNYAAVAGGGDPYNGGVPNEPNIECKDSHCASAVSTISASDAVLSVVKTSNQHIVELGDMLSYTVVVTNIGKHVVLMPVIEDQLPAGFRLIDKSSRVQGATLLGVEGTPGPLLRYRLDKIESGVSVTLTYRVRIGVGSMEGNGTNVATALCPHNRNTKCANDARVKVRVTGGVFTEKACIVGMIFVDCNANQLKDETELGIPGVRMYLEDGTYLISDSEGKYSYCGLTPKTHVLKVDKTTLPQGSQLGMSSNRNMGDPNSLFIDLKKGQLHRADFIEKTCSESVLKAVKARGAQGEITGPQGSTAFTFENKARNDPLYQSDKLKIGEFNHAH